MDAIPRDDDDCLGCPNRIICHCLQITEDVLLRAVETGDVQTLRELRQHTGAGDGCTACHRELHVVLQRRTELVMVQPSSSASPI